MKGGLFVSWLALDAVSIESALSTAFTSMKEDILGYIAVVLPIALAITGAFFGIRASVKFFKSIGKG